ncbi:hypothetical protein [Pseudorhodoferax sp. Leaf274]|uniref:hypothetical protein n=1 Tax=Pseudorhodoferax sp. Leaf274 TaxID=1736318 RepID=UPI00070271C7|nr:hypothetical protein [Pseudorhodoferax sp. Leaf274]KQP45475.1 hypothetical protein ASF44_25220 [Pseudorhodoferax sp. Leaf274]
MQLNNIGTMTNQTEQGAAEAARPGFEAWASSQNWVIDRDSFGDYVYGSVCDGWEAYRAGLADARRQASTPEGYGSVATHAPCKGMACGITRTDQEHSLECQAEHTAAIAGGRFVKEQSNG